MGLSHGRVVDGRYQIQEQLATRESCDTYLATPAGQGHEKVAIKVLRTLDGAMFGELSGLTQIDDTQLALVRHCGEVEGHPYVAREWVEGPDLVEAARLLPVAELRRLLERVCDGLTHLHGRGIPHGRLRPSNLRVTRKSGSGEKTCVKILDFGLSRLLRTEAAHDKQNLAYSAPELLSGGAADSRSDLYSLGVTLYQVLSGGLPFHSSDPAVILRGHLEEAPRPIDPSSTGAPGDLINIALRLLMKDPADRFGSAAEVREALGHAESIAAFRPEPSLADPHEPGRPILVGRDLELRAMETFLDGHQQQPGEGASLLLLLGESGIGKTRLLAELLQMARGRSIPVHQGVCHESAGAPFGPFVGILQWAASIAETDCLRHDGEEAHREGDLIDRYGPELVKIAPRLFSQRRVSASADLQPQYERLRLVDSVGSLLLEVSRHHPALMLLEDLQWADDASADLVAYLLRNRMRGRILVAAAARPGESRAAWLKDGLEQEGGANSILRLPLAGLDEDEIALVAGSVLNARQLPADLPALVLQESGGNPFFVHEVLRDLVEEEVLRRGEGGWQWHERLKKTRHTPATISHALERRLSRSSEQQLRLLQACAILNRPSDDELLQAVASSIPEATKPRESGNATSPCVEWTGSTRNLLERGLLLKQDSPSGLLYGLAHHATRELLMRQMNSAVSSSGHRAAGTFLESRHADVIEEHVERIAYHFIQAGDDDKSARYALQAAHRARKLHSNEEASYFYLQALKYHPQPDDPDRWAALGSLGDVYLLQGKVRHAATRFEEMRRLAEGASDAEAMVGAYLGLAETQRRTSQFKEQMRYARIAFGTARKAGLDAGQGDALQVLGLAHYEQGMFHKAIRCFSLALGHLRGSGEEVITAHVLNRLGLAHMSMGRMKRARQQFDRALDIAGNYKLSLRSVVHNNIGCVLENCGDYGASLTRYRTAESVACEAGDKNNTALAVLNQASVLVRLNMPRHARESVRTGLRMAVETGDQRFQAFLLTLQGQIELDLKEPDLAIATLMAASELATKIGHLEISLLARCETARTHLARGDASRAASQLALLWEEASKSNVQEVAASAAVSAAEAFLRKRDYGETESFLARARDALLEPTYPEVEWKIHLIAGQLAEARDQPEQAAVHFKAGTSVLERIAANIEEPELRDSYLREPRRLELRLKGSRAILRQDLARHETDELGLLPAIEALAELSDSLPEAETQEEVATAALAKATTVVGARHALLITQDRDGNTRTLASVGDSAHLPDHARRQALLQRVLSGDSLRLPASSSPAPHEEGPGIGIWIPLRARGSIAGAMCLVGTASTRAYGRLELPLLRTIAGQAALALARLELVEQAGENTAIVQSAGTVSRLGDMIGGSSAMQALFRQIQKIAGSHASVLVTGESGTGKELAARAIHENSTRSGNAFVAVDCGAIPENLAESELFGHRRGAFSGADAQHQGLVLSSDGGTLFLDEVGNMPLALQAKVLRVLQAGEVRRVGGTGSKKVDFRLVAATNADLANEVRAGRFRQDLFYRLAGISVELPPLRNRVEDIPHLAEHFLQEICREEGRATVRLSEAVMRALSSHSWPGNVRELRNVLGSCVALAEGDVIVARDLPQVFRSGQGTFPEKGDDLDRLVAALRETGGDKSAAARRLGWSRMRVYRMLKRAGLPLDFGRPEAGADAEGC